MSTVTTGPEPDDIGDDEGIPAELVDLYIAVEEGDVTHDQLADLANAGFTGRPDYGEDT